jgi:hypothetical protein
MPSKNGTPLAAGPADNAAPPQDNRLDKTPVDAHLCIRNSHEL